MNRLPILTLKLMASLTLLCVVLIGLTTVVGLLLPADIILLETARLINDEPQALLHISLLDVQRGWVGDLIEGSSQGYGLQWSPDGQQVAFTYPQQILLMDMTGSNVRPLIPQQTLYQIFPRWSPDGKSIVFLLYDSPSQQYHLQVADVASGQMHQVSDLPAHRSLPPEWSPDGRQIAFISEEILPNQDTLYVVNADGTGLRHVTNTGGRQTYNTIVSDMEWSGQYLVIALVIPNVGTEIYRVNVGTGELIQLTDLRTSSYDPVWSPDGTRIAFLSHPINYSEIYVMDADGQNLQRLTFNTLGEGDIIWTPDGTHIVYVAYHDDGTSQVYIMNEDGTNLRLVADISSTALSWRPQ